MNKPKPIKIGNHVWIGCRCLILKGSVVGDNCVVAANTSLCKAITGDMQLIAGSPAKIVKQNVVWED